MNLIEPKFSKTIALVCVVLASLLQGCASPKYNYRPAMADVSEPPLNAISQRGVGEEMVKQGKFMMLDLLKVNTSVRVAWAYTVEPGLFRFTGSDELSNYYQIGGMGDESGSITRAALADPYKSIMLKHSPKELCVITFINAYVCKGDLEGSVSMIQRPVLYENSLQQTLIYNGRIGNRISIGYREFSNNYARPAFNNNVDYDLNESSIIGYKGAEIEVLEATNRYIKYRLIRNFNSVNQPTPSMPSERNNTSQDKKQDSV